MGAGARIEVSIGKELGVEQEPDESQIEAICKPVSDYHRSLQTRDLELLAASVADSVYRVYCSASDRLAEWEPWPRLAREQILTNFGHAFDSDGFYYENQVEFTHVMLNGNEAFVRTVETGRTWKSRTWEKVEVLWHSTRTDDGSWQVAGHIHRLS